MNKSKKRKGWGCFSMEEEDRAPARRGVICREPGLDGDTLGDTGGGRITQMSDLLLPTTIKAGARRS
jgi:hypothetical protein